MKERLRQKDIMAEEKRIEMSTMSILTCTQGKEAVDGVCVWSKASKVCQAKWRDGLYYLNKSDGCACRSGKSWNKKERKCKTDVSKEPSVTKF